VSEAGHTKVPADNGQWERAVRQLFGGLIEDHVC
jgi:hypothetical protein